MPRKSGSVSRRNFLATTGGLIAATPLAARGVPAEAPATALAAPAIPSPPEATRKIPLGVFATVFGDLSLDQMIDKVVELGLEAVEIGAGGYAATRHCPTQELLADPARARDWKKKFTDRNLLIGALSAHGNPLHPDPAKAAQFDTDYRNAILLAERLDVPVVVGFSGCPGGSPSDKTPNWATYRWPPDYADALKWQWSEKVIPYWVETAKFARQHGVHRLALEMHPGFAVFNPKTLLELRDAAGEEVGANCDLSHLFWQGCDPVAVIRLLSKHDAIFHAHMKDTVMFKENVAKYGVLNFGFTKAELPEASETFRAVGYGHGAELWKDVVRAYMESGYEGMMSIENEDPILSGAVGVERAAYVLKNVRSELLEEAA